MTTSSAWSDVSNPRDVLASGVCRFTYQHRNSQVCASHISHTLCHVPGTVSIRTLVSTQVFEIYGHSASVRPLIPLRLTTSKAHAVSTTMTGQPHA